MTTHKKAVTARPCPMCKKAVQRPAEDFPFCSARCKNIDLGNWASDGYAIADNNPDSFDDLEEALHQALDDDSRNIH